MPPEGVVDAGGGLLRVARHGLHKHLERALQQHVDAGVVVVVVAAGVAAERSVGGAKHTYLCVCVCARHTHRIP